MVRIAIGRWWCLLVLLLGSACLEVDGQDLVVRVDPANDRIDVLLVHRGLFASARSGVDGEPLPRALRDLDEVRRTGRIVLWHDRLLSFDPSAEPTPELAPLQALVDVENGGLFTDPAGRLCAWQFVRVRSARAFVRTLDALLAARVQQTLAHGIDLGDGRHRFDDDSRRAFAASQRDGEPLLEVNPGRIELRLPLSPRDHAWAKDQLAKLLLRQLPYDLVARHFAGDAAGSPRSAAACEPLGSLQLPAAELPHLLAEAASVRFFVANDVAVVRSPGITSLLVGSGECAELALHKPANALGDDALAVALRANGTAIEVGVPDAELRRRFAAFAARDAVLPPELAARRQRPDAAAAAR